MNKEQALHAFWSSFGLTAYDQNTVPDNATLPYITYEVAVDDFKYPVSLSASIWDRGTSWTTITEKLNRISEAIGLGGINIPYDNGSAWMTKGNPFAQRLSDENHSIRRIFLNVEVEFIN